MSTENRDKGFYAAAGLAKRAGKLAQGTGACLDGLKKGKVFLTVIAEDTSENTIKKTKAACERNAVECIVYGNSELMGKALGREKINIIGISDRELKKLILSKMQIERR